MKIFVQKMDPSAKLPKYAYEGDAGMDLFSFENMEVKAGERCLVSTGIKIAVPTGYAGLVWDKSGIATKHHITTIAGVIDSNYRGELKVALTNLGKESYNIKKGEKIAQMLIQPIVSGEIKEVEKLEDTERGESGFGSSGLQ